MKRYRRQAGDTIVEVLIAIAIVSLILGGAYALTNQNLTNTRHSQEHSQALQLLQTQIEALRAAGDLLKPVMAAPYTFCMQPPPLPPAPPQGYTPSAKNAFASDPASKTADDDGQLPNNFGEYPPAPNNVCDFDAAGNNTNATEPIYHIFIDYTPPDATSDYGTFRVTARWHAVGGHNIEEATLYYRLPPLSAASMEVLHGES